MHTQQNEANSGGKHVFKEGWFVHLTYMNGTKGQFTVIL